MIDKERMALLAKEYKIELSPKQLEQLDQYAALLVEWNQKMNLTAITGPKEIEIKHFLDSLLFASQPQIVGKVLDVGSGAGFPGMVTQIFRPELVVTLLEPTGKRVAFLHEVSKALSLPLVTVKERAEEAARKQWREQYDIVTARAVAALPVLCEYLLPLVRVGGLAIAMKAEADEELKQASKAVEKLGGHLKDVHKYKLPDGAQRSLILIEKVKETPPVYPRNGGVIAKRPL